MLQEKIKKEDFFKYLELLRRNNEYVNAIYNASNRTIDLINFEQEITEPYLIIVKAFFTADEFEIIGWYMYEYDKDGMKVYDAESGEEIANLVDDEALWEYLNRE